MLGIDFYIGENEYSNHFIINDSIHGDTNVMLPLYINKNHWSLTKSLWKYHISFINNSFESEYHKKMDNIYYLVLLKYLNNLLNDNKNTNSNIKLLIYILRTVIQVTIDNKYVNNINNEYNKYYNYLINLDYNKFKLNLIDYIIRYLQYCVSYGDISNLEYNLKYIRNKILDKWLEEKYFKNIMYKEHYDSLLEIEQKLELELIKNNFISENINWISLELTLIKISKILNSIYKIKGFNQFIKIIDKTNSYIQDNITNNCEDTISCECIKKIIDDNNIIDIEYIKSQIIINFYKN
jgi:hypothetical protein